MIVGWMRWGSATASKIVRNDFAEQVLVEVR